MVVLRRRRLPTPSVDLAQLLFLPTAQAFYIGSHVGLAIFFTQASTRRLRPKIILAYIALFFLAIIALSFGGCAAITGTSTSMAHSLLPPAAISRGNCTSTDHVTAASLREICPKYKTRHAWIGMDPRISRQCSLSAMKDVVHYAKQAVLLTQVGLNTLVPTEVLNESVIARLKAPETVDAIREFTCVTLFPPCRYEDCAVLEGFACGKVAAARLYDNVLGPFGHMKTSIEQAFIAQLTHSAVDIGNQFVGGQTKCIVYPILEPLFHPNHNPTLTTCNASVPMTNRTPGASLTNDLVPAPVINCYPGEEGAAPGAVPDDAPPNCGFLLGALVGITTVMVGFAATADAGRGQQRKVTEHRVTAGETTTEMRGTDGGLRRTAKSVCRATGVNMVLHISDSAERRFGGVRITPMRALAAFLSLVCAVLAFCKGAESAQDHQLELGLGLGLGGWSLVYFLVAAASVCTALKQLLPSRKSQRGSCSSSSSSSWGEGAAVHVGSDGKNLGVVGWWKRFTQTFVYRVLFDPQTFGGWLYFARLTLAELVETVQQLIAVDQTAKDNDAHLVLITVTILTLNAAATLSTSVVMTWRRADIFVWMSVLVVVDCCMDLLLLATNIFLRQDSTPTNASFLSWERLVLEGSIIYPLWRTRAAAGKLMRIRQAKRNEVDRLDRLAAIAPSSSSHRKSNLQRPTLIGPMPGRRATPSRRVLVPKTTLRRCLLPIILALLLASNFISLLIIQANLTVAYVTQRGLCEKQLGNAATCAWPQRYFSSLAGPTTCGWEYVTSLQCASSGVDNLPDAEVVGLDAKTFKLLVSVDLSHNAKLSRVPTYFAHFPQLRHINLSHTALVHLPHALCTLNLTSVDIAGTPAATSMDWARTNPPLTSLDTVSEACISAMSELRFFNLAHNRLGKGAKELSWTRPFWLPAPSMQYFPQLMLVDLTNNSIEAIKIDDGGRWLISALGRAEMGQNKLAAHGSAHGPFVLQDNPIRNVSIKPISSKESASRVLEWFANEVAGTRAQRARFETIQFRTGQMLRCPDGVFDDARQLRELDHGMNRLTTIPSLIGLTNLRSLKLHNNHLTVVPRDLLRRNLPSLETLGLENNRMLQDFSGTTWSGLSKLTRLRVGGTALRRLRADAFAGLPSIQL